jgi:hypothetical protein
MQNIIDFFKKLEKYTDRFYTLNVSKPPFTCRWGEDFLYYYKGTNANWLRIRLIDKGNLEINIY